MNISSTSSSIDCNSSMPEDVLNFLLQSGIDVRRLEIYRKNIVIAFTNPSIIAEIIHYRYPKLVLLHRYIDGESLKDRSQNWNVLNKTLSKLRCCFAEEELDLLIRRSLSKEAIYTFLRLLKSKLDSFEPLYLSKVESVSNSTNESLTTPNLKGRRVSILTGEVLMPSGAHSSTSKSNTLASTYKPTSKLQEPSSKVDSKPSLSTEDIDRMYHEISQRLQIRNKNITNHIDTLQAKSDLQNSELVQMRSLNLEELERTERKLERLNMEYKEIVSRIDMQVGCESNPHVDSVFKFEGKQRKS